MIVHAFANCRRRVYTMNGCIGHLTVEIAATKTTASADRGRQGPNRPSGAPGAAMLYGSAHCRAAVAFDVILLLVYRREPNEYTILPG